MGQDSYNDDDINLSTVWLWALGYGVAIRADIRDRNRFAFWANDRTCLYRLVPQPYSRKSQADSRIKDDVNYESRKSRE